MKKAILALADGTVLEGRALGFAGETSGEVVFNTAMTGYQEILTDPSYKGQMVLMTCPHIGNYGISPEDNESRRTWAEGFIVNESSRRPSNWRSELSLHEYLVHHRMVGIEGIDTRYLTRHLRTYGSQAGIIAHTDNVNGSPDALVAKANALPSISKQDLVEAVTCNSPYEWNEGTGAWPQRFNARGQIAPMPARRFHVAVYDFGVKQNILRRLVDEGCAVTVVPASTTAETIRTMNPDGVFLSNGPGDPEKASYAVPHIRDLLGWRPVMGICLGHQILGLALGLSAYKLKFGHHGANHPVMDLRSGRVEITSQNHNFAVRLPSAEQPECPPAPPALSGVEGSRVEGSEVERLETPWGQFQATHVSLNDQSLEGLVGTTVPVLSVQYHPEASPGPHDSSYLFGQFRAMMEHAHV